MFDQRTLVLVSASPAQRNIDCDAGVVTATDAPADPDRKVGPPKGEWQCTVCGKKNVGEAAKCVICGRQHGHAEKKAAATQRRADKAAASAELD